MNWNMGKHYPNLWVFQYAHPQVLRARPHLTEKQKNWREETPPRMSLLATHGGCSKRPTNVRCVKKLLVPAHHALGRCHHTTTDSCNKGTTLSISAWSFAGSEMWAICSRQNAALLVRKLENVCTLSIQDRSTTNAVNCKNHCFCGHCQAAQMRVDECTHRAIASLIQHSAKERPGRQSIPCLEMNRWHIAFDGTHISIV